MFEAKSTGQNIITAAVPLVGLLIAFGCTSYGFCKSLSPQAFRKVAALGGKEDLLTDELGNSISDEGLKPKIGQSTFDPTLTQAYQKALHLRFLVWQKKEGQGHPIVKE